MNVNFTHFMRRSHVRQAKLDLHIRVIGHDGEAVRAG